jgi:hypothetical protein
MARLNPRRRLGAANSTWMERCGPCVRRVIGRIHSMRCVLREVRDEDLAVLFEQWADPVAVRMAAFTAPDHMDRAAFERRWSRLRADETVIARAIVVGGDVAGTIGSWGDRDERESRTGLAAPTGARGSRPAPSTRSWLLSRRARSTRASLKTTLRRAVSSRSAAFASSQLNEASLKRVPPKSRRWCCGSRSPVTRLEVTQRRRKARAARRRSPPSRASSTS